jgi:hypothetical protein
MSNLTNSKRTKEAGWAQLSTMNGGGRDACFVDLFVCVVVSRASTRGNLTKFERQVNIRIQQPSAVDDLRELPQT